MWKKVMNRYAASTKEMNKDLIEYIGTMPAIKAFSNEEGRTAIVKQHMKDYISWVKKMMFTISGSLGIGQLIMETGTVFMVIVGARLLSAGDVSVTDFILALILSSLFSASVTAYVFSSCR